MKIDKEFVTKTVSRIDELQNEMICKSNSIPGINDYVKKEMDSFSKSIGIKPGRRQRDKKNTKLRK